MSGGVIGGGQIKPTSVLLLGPHRDAVSGVSTHLNLLLSSELAQKFRLMHFQVGSEGRNESAIGRLARLLASPFALAATLRNENVDILHLNTSLNRRAYWRDLAYLVVARLAGTRIVYQIHGGDLPEQFCRHSPFRMRFLRASFRLPHSIVVLARCEHAAYLQFARGNQVCLLPNAIDCTPYLKLPAPRPTDRQPLRLIYIGRLAREKGLFDALKGLQLARLGGADVHLTLAGSGPDEAGLKQAVNALRLTEVVHFAGPVFGDGKVRLLGEADVLLFPTYAEGLPYALLECMAAGLPAITTRVGAIPDVLVENAHGLFVKPRDTQAIGQAISRLAADRSLVAKMGTACREQVSRHYAIPRLAGDFSRLYHSVAPPKRQGGVARI